MTPEAHTEFLREIEQDIATLTDRIVQLRLVADYHASKLGLPQRTQPSVPSNGHHRNGQHRFRHMNQREAAEVIIREHGQPMRAGDIARAMVAYGYPRPETMSKLANSLFTTMTRDEKRFHKVGTGLWALTEKNTQEQEGE